MFKIENWGSDTSNIKNSLGGPAYFRYYNQENNDITTAGYFPDNLRLKEGDRIVVIPQDTDAVDELYVVTAVNNGTPTVSKATGGGDEHNKGYFADLTALQTAYPTGANGDYAILGSTDTVWVWDSGTNAWVDTDTKGEVTSVNGQTGAVSLSIPDAVQYSTMPTAGADNLGDIVQFTGTTDANYTNGYFYKCVSDGQDPATYSWEAVEVQASSGGLPDQTGQSGKFLTTDGTDASWSDVTQTKNCYNEGQFQIGGNNSAALYLTRDTTSTSSFSGGVLTPTNSLGGGLEIKAVAGAIYQGRAYVFSRTALIPNYLGVSGSIDLGSSSYMWKTVFAQKLNNGADITVPQNTTGTIVVATPPTSDGTYVLKATVSSGVVTYTWVAE